FKLQRRMEDGMQQQLRLAARRSERAQQRLAQLLSNPGGGAIVQHCAVGKDRTGVGSALVLFALGADEATVLEDYLLTETTLATFREQMLD
ncbi:tyrosine-protein phosphatase, partial [Enterobacter hormaechei]|uniref:tyrosine-protein phosphatase n=1 Tax=Enterobacter hormaechei TaxID=158836 RepID=UPI001F3AD7FA